ncbi:MAG TPA: NAD(P)-dependent oxidoreductase [Alphaproteobacteria bacterium]|nr:NAD(P)-dependent oxidoreductase [Alphaproteobacteria bacterium]
MAKVAFIGLGTMGYPMAGHLSRAGHFVTVYNRTEARADWWRADYSGKIAKTPAEAAHDAEIVFACVGRDADIREVTLGPNGAFGAMKKGSVFVDHTTASASLARELGKAAEERGFGFIDAPVSGGQSGAEAGQLTIMCGGKPEDYAKAELLMMHYAKAMKLMGPWGAGQLTKMVNQICIAGVLAGLSEGMNFAERAGLDTTKVFEAISKGAAQSWQMDNRVKTMIEHKFDFGFAVDWMRKDLGMCIEEAKHNGAALPVTSLVDQFYAEVQKVGGARWDTSSLIERLRSRSF